MSNLPFTLPTCDQPATVRVEVYGPDAGMASGSLDAAAYLCELHLITGESAIWRAKLTPYRVTLAPDIERPCGEVYVFATGNLGGQR
ncbi:MAG TPA: hypothetical protein VIQ30_00920 [Pseudonocardia sp.]